MIVSEREYNLLEEDLKRKRSKRCDGRIKKNYSDSQEIYLQGITFREFYKKYFSLGISLGRLKTYVKLIRL